MRMPVSRVLHTAHWRWESEPVEVEGREGLITTGKKNTINNFCIGVQGNWAKCTSCHTGYGWEDAKTLILRIRATLTAWPAMTIQRHLC